MAIPAMALMAGGGKILESALGLGMDIWKQKQEEKLRKEEMRRQAMQEAMNQQIGAYKDFSNQQGNQFNNMANLFTRTLLG
jgi:chemotaxis protein CheY-P-specific phosphatase CheC